MRRTLSAIPCNAAVFQAPGSAPLSLDVGPLLIAVISKNAVKKALAGYVDALPEGLTPAARADRLAALEAELYDLEVDEEEAIAEAEMAGGGHPAPPVPAMVFCAFASESKTFYIPETYTPDHVLLRLLGEDAFLGMIANFGGETICVPSMRLDNIRNIGKVYRLSRQGLSAREIEAVSGLGYRNIKYIQARIESNQPLSQLTV